MKTLSELLVIACVMLALDSVYLYSMQSIVTKQITSVQGSNIQFRYLGAILCYTILITGLYYFIVKDRRSVFDAYLLGILVYAVYETTNYATFKKWTETMLVIDTLWGGILLALTTYITYRIFNVKPLRVI
jgi:uncharacterized membrane protein